MLAGALATCVGAMTGCGAAADAVAANDTSGPYTGPQVTLLVTNATCQGGSCDSLDVRLYPQDELITPAGLWSVSLGVVTARQACLMVPLSEVQRIIAEGAHPDTTVKTWTPGLAASLGGLEPRANVFASSPSTSAIIMGGAAGWSVTLPGGQPVAGARCTG
jgi:hypothetical protein